MMHTQAIVRYAEYLEEKASLINDFVVIFILTSIPNR